MKDLISGLNKNFESRVRLGIMSLLMVNDWLEFGEIREYLELTDGNLSSHGSALEKLGYITVRKEFKGKKPVTTYGATNEGRKAFESHLDALEKLIKR